VVVDEGNERKIVSLKDFFGLTAAIWKTSI